eukprot:TRINITY_DN60616_c0_g1_i1.p1 TRINITY_DN60616_c0_g1~~TRINITY_DN60616_c0_g1_i1.p1  ORF type:complete len:156 (+),score=4.02 TRINITY_DN60616_c0_g1_i1:76-543(+)
MQRHHNENNVAHFGLGICNNGMVDSIEVWFPVSNTRIMKENVLCNHEITIKEDGTFLVETLPMPYNTPSSYTVSEPTVSEPTISFSNPTFSEPSTFSDSSSSRILPSDDSPNRSNDNSNNVSRDTNSSDSSDGDTVIYSMSIICFCLLLFFQQIT